MGIGEIGDPFRGSFEGMFINPFNLPLPDHGPISIPGAADPHGSGLAKDDEAIGGGGSGTSAHPKAFEVSITQGALPSTEGTATVAAGHVELYGPEGPLFTAIAEHVTGTGLSALSNGINMLYLTFDWSSTPVGDVGIVTGASETAALAAIYTAVSDMTETTIKPLALVTYNSTSKQITAVKIYHEGNWEPTSLYSYDAP